MEEKLRIAKKSCAQQQDPRDYGWKNWFGKKILCMTLGSSSYRGKKTVLAKNLCFDISNLVITRKKLSVAKNLVLGIRNFELSPEKLSQAKKSLARHQKPRDNK